MSNDSANPIGDTTPTIEQMVQRQNLDVPDVTVFPDGKAAMLRSPRC